MTSASRHVSHQWNLVIDLVLLTAVTLYIVWEARRKRSAEACQYGPACMVAIGSLLILADPLRHVLNDRGTLTGAGMYIHNCPVRALQQPPNVCAISSDCGTHDCGNDYYSVNPGEDCYTCWTDGMCSEGAESFRCLTTVGWIVTIVCTYIGFSLFFVGVLWNSRLLPKMIEQWKVLRGR